MRSKPETPYERLRRAVLRYISRVGLPKSVGMWMYPRARLSDGWRLLDLWERTKAADQLGHDVRLIAKDDGLHVVYVERPGEIGCNL